MDTEDLTIHMKIITTSTALQTFPAPAPRLLRTNEKKKVVRV